MQDPSLEKGAGQKLFGGFFPPREYPPPLSANLAEMGSPPPHYRKFANLAQENICPICGVPLPTFRKKSAKQFLPVPLLLV